MSKKYILPLMLAASFIVPGMIASADAAQETRVYRWHTFDEWDVNRDGYIDNPEYEEYSFHVADTDRDGRIQNDEWTNYTRTFYDPWKVSYKTVTYYDTDGDGYVERQEFKRFVSKDADGNLYRTWDHDHDNRISPDDWRQVTTYYTTSTPYVTLEPVRPTSPPNNYNN